jgi:hypothetical protein
MHKSFIKFIAKYYKPADVIFTWPSLYVNTVLTYMTEVNKNVDVFFSANHAFLE